MVNVKEILGLWFKVRETKKEYLPIYEFGHRNPWEYEIKRDVEQASELDPEGITALLILDNFRSDFFSNCGISIKEILTNPNFPTFVSDCNRLTAMLSDEEIVSVLTEFVGNVTNAIKHMGIERKDVYDMINDRYEMGLLRRDSLRSMETLHFHQFFQGDTQTDHLAFLPDIHMFWNMNSLIRCAWQSSDGVSINLIKDPLATSSFFAFVAKNGGNLTVLTDKPKEAHPLSKYMSRRPERDFTCRVFRNHFPYGFLDITYDSEGYLNPGKTSIVPLQEKPIRIGSIGDMLPDEIIWTVMMFSLIDAKLYKENYHCAELSYTSDMIEDPDAYAGLLERNQSGALMVKDYKPLIAPALTVANLEHDRQFEKYEDSGVYRYLYERYKDQIPDEILNGLLPNDDKTLFLLSDSTTFLAPKERTTSGWYNEEPVLLADPSSVKSTVLPGGGRCYSGKMTIDDAVVLKKMTGDEFGSREDLLQDYKWFARYNAAKFIRQKAEAEYAQRKGEVLEWVKSRIEQNLEHICKDIIREKLTKEKTEHPCRFAMTEMKGEWWSEITTHGSIAFAKDRKAHLRRPGTVYYPFHNNADAGCWFSEDAPCSYILRASATSVRDLLYLTGCSDVEELPDVLRHWCHSSYSRGYTGNPILYRVDPMDWVVKDPWDGLHFDPVIGIGKKYLSKVKKELGL